MPELRRLPLFLLPPQDGVTKLAKTFRHKLYQIVGALCGLANAPKTRNNRVVKILLSLGFVQHSLAKMLFYLYRVLPGDKRPSLVAVLVAYVDDFLVSYNKRWNKSELMQMFTWGNRDELKLDGHLEFKSKTISLKYFNEKQRYFFKLTQTKFIEAMPWRESEKAVAGHDPRPFRSSWNTDRSLDVCNGYPGKCVQI